VKPDIFLITIDSLRRDHVSLYGQTQGVTPFLDKLAENSTVFTNAYAAGLWTDPAIVSLYTGLYPSQHRILAGIDTQLVKRTLADVLSANGYETMMVGTGSRYISKERSIVRGFNTTIDTFDIKRVHGAKHLLGLDSYRWGILKALAYNSLLGPDCRLYYSLNRFKEFLRNRQEGPLFAHVHLWFFNAWYSVPRHKKWPFLLRQPGFNYRSYLKLRQKVHQIRKKSVRVAHKYLCDEKFLDKDDLQTIRLLYAASVNYMDFCLAALFRWAEKEGYRNNTIWIITSDHGEMLGEHELLGHNFSYYQEIIRVPLLIFGPEWIQPHRVSNLVTHADIPNAFLKLLEINERLGGEGECILDPGFLHGRSDRSVFFEDGCPGDIAATLRTIDPQVDFLKWDFAVKGVVQNSWKYAMKSNGSDELYNLEEDQGERHNRVAEHARLAQELRETIVTQLGRFDPGNPIGL